MKEQKLHHSNLFAATNIPNLPSLETSDEVMQPFSPQLLMAKSCDAKGGLNSLDVYGVGCAKLPATLIIDVLQEKGVASRF
jgi:hypothetical protein